VLCSAAMSPLEGTLLEKLRKIEALHAGVRPLDCRSLIVAPHPARGSRSAKRRGGRSRRAGRARLPAATEPLHGC
jgi:hypothetical protein